MEEIGDFPPKPATRKTDSRSTEQHVTGGTLRSLPLDGCYYSKGEGIPLTPKSLVSRPLPDEGSNVSNSFRNY